MVAKHSFIGCIVWIERACSLSPISTCRPLFFHFWVKSPSAFELPSFISVTINRSLLLLQSVYLYSHSSFSFLQTPIIGSCFIQDSLIFLCPWPHLSMGLVSLLICFPLLYPFPNYLGLKTCSKFSYLRERVGGGYLLSLILFLISFFLLCILFP